MIRTNTNTLTHAQTRTRTHSYTRTHTVARAEPKHLTQEGAATDKKKTIRYVNYDYLLCFLHFRTLHSWHLFSFFLLNSLNTHHKAELPQQQRSLRPWQLQLTASFAFYMQWKQKQNDAQASAAQCKIERERACERREHKRAQLAQPTRARRPVYVMCFYCCCFVFRRWVIAPRSSLCTRQELNAIWAHTAKANTTQQRGEP